MRESNPGVTQERITVSVVPVPGNVYHTPGFSTNTLLQLPIASSVASMVVPSNVSPHTSSVAALHESFAGGSTAPEI